MGSFQFSISKRDQVDTDRIGKVLFLLLAAYLGSNSAVAFAVAPSCSGQQIEIFDPKAQPDLHKEMPKRYRENIQTLIPDAIALQKKFNLPASLILAQKMTESWFNLPNNNQLFGVKCSRGNAKGNVVKTMNDGTKFTLSNCANGYQSYPTPGDAMKHYVHNLLFDGAGNWKDKSEFAVPAKKKGAAPTMKFGYGDIRKLTKDKRPPCFRVVVV